ncbi:MAG: alpha-glucan family phosphorylase [Candidatus Eisenbacteria bacterium]|uniref:Alpha-glucan family phosphorylase n=1 Tax=Eiseniibacteriota bacterium TaxID=2212470 RepID=A0A948RWG1_UNCEI|nr:alpha-glucan family phosphorylase [Candidatus Eisenbacteria bacterium]MBU2689524.1 alpha-glucan family phosphorylase [Candidatus Eisenbacteria bacterium]
MRELARNLQWTWQPEVIRLFRAIDPALFRSVKHNPVELLARFSKEDLEKRATDLALEPRINFAFHRLREYLDNEHTWGAFHGGPLHSRPVAYFSAEFGLHESLPIFSGGLGVLAGDHLKAASDLGVPLVGVGLFYAQGYFNQEINPEGWQSEHYFESDVELLPMDHALGPDGEPIFVKVKTRESEIKLGIWSAQVGRNRLILLDSDVEGNSDADRALTTTLYGGDQRVRIRQEHILGVGGLRALCALEICPGVIHMNEGHSAFAVLELARKLMERDAKTFSEVEETAASMTVFTTHTPVEAGHDRFSAELVESTIGPLREQIGLSEKELLGLGRVNPDNNNELFCMTVLGMKMARSINGVSAIHGRVSRAMWQSLWPETEVHQIPIGHITNGVHVHSWLAVPMAQLYDRYLREKWKTRVCYPETWERIFDIEDTEFWEVHQILKVRLVDFVERAIKVQHERWAKSGAKINNITRLDPAALTVGFARRAATYKRLGLLLDDIERFDRLVNHPEHPVQFVFSGKAHPADEPGKKLIQRVCRVTQDPRFQGKIFFVEDYGYNVSRHLVQGVDVWLNTPRRPLEACGTSGEKVLLNGGLNLSILDGWWAEAFDGTNGFAIGEGGEHANLDKQDAYDREATYNAFENEVIPLFYDRDEQGLPRGWIHRVKRAISSLGWKFNADRMVQDYTRNCYLPACGGFICSFPRGALERRLSKSGH